MSDERVTRVVVGFRLQRPHGAKFSGEEFQRHLQRVLMDALYEYERSREGTYLDQDIPEEEAKSALYRSQMAHVLKNSVQEIEIETGD